ncbi:heme NO-binding domain-containing protein [Paracoccus sp. ME4]|uniref:heme NO-binding domain-containing protein n=1 Tax=Paracoccus sp. ME4 TaxID=3138066 RepID=UPI00398AE206
MNGLINRAIEEFLRSTYGEGLVQAVLEETAVAAGSLSGGILAAGSDCLDRAAFRLRKPRSEMIEDLGGWMTRIEPIRRLLRFSGRDFRDFLLRLDELPGRAHLVLPDLVVPPIEVASGDQTVWLIMLDLDESWQHFLIGLIRGMADDYGALCLIAADDAAIRVDIWDEQFAEGRLFSLQAMVPAGTVLS